MSLVKLGVPFDVAYAMDWDEATAWQIVAGEIEGGEWDWRGMCWRDPR